jgi:hypothetical protein
LHRFNQFVVMDAAIILTLRTCLTAVTHGRHT